MKLIDLLKKELIGKQLKVVLVEYEFYDSYTETVRICRMYLLDILTVEMYKNIKIVKHAPVFKIIKNIEVIEEYDGDTIHLLFDENEAHELISIRLNNELTLL